MAAVVLGTRLRETRIAAGLTLHALARGLGVSAPFLSDVEHGRRALTERRIRDAAAVMSVDPARLLDATFPRDSVRALENDSDLLLAVRRAMRSKRVRALVLKAAGVRRD